MNQSILAKLKELCHEMLKDKEKTDQIGENTLLREDLGFASLYMMWMAFALESEFGIALSDLKIEDLNTVGDICLYIEEQTETQK